MGQRSAVGKATRYELHSPTHLPTLPSVAIKVKITGSDRLWILVSQSYHSALWNPIRVTGSYLV
jgi:hypothetical protein